MTSAYDSLILGESGLQAFYPLNESSGTTAFDLSSNAYNGTYSGTGVTYGVTSLLGQDSETAITLDGASGIITLPSGLSPSGWTALTVEFWVNQAGKTQGTNPRIISNLPSSSTAVNQSFDIGLTGNAGGGGNPEGFFAAVGNGTSASGWSSNAQFPDKNTTYYVAFTWGSGTLRCYVNGALQYYTASLSGSLAAGLSQIVVGHNAFQGAYFGGTLQKLAIYNAALTQAKLQGHFTAGATAAGGSYSSVVLADSPARYYRLGDAVSSTTAADASTNAITGTVNSTAHAVFGQTGALLYDTDTALNVDGSGHITESSTTGLPTAAGHGSCTIECWLKPTGAATATPLWVGGSGGNAGLFLVQNTSSAPYALMGGTFGGTQTDGVYVENTTYHHLAVVWDGTNISLYGDGSFWGKAANTITWSYGTNALAIGCDSDGSSFPFHGYLDEVAVYSSALSAARIQAHYVAAITNNVVTGSATAIANATVGVQPGVGPATIAAIANATFSAVGGVTSPTGAATYTLLLGGAAVNLIAGSLDLTNQLGQRSQGRASVWTGTGIVYDYGTSVSVVDDKGTTIYTGFVLEDQVTLAGLAPKILQHDLTIADNHYLADKRLAHDSFLNTVAGVIVKSMWQAYLAAEGVTIGAIADGVWLPEFVANYEPVSAQFDKLAAMCGFWWEIDEKRRLFFQPYGAKPGPYTIDGTTIDQTQQFSCTIGNKDYRNRQYGVGGRDHTAVLTENFVGDGKRRQWTLRYPVASLQGHDPKSGLTKGIYLNGVLQTNVAPKSAGQNTEWGYAISDAVVAQWDTYPVLTSGDNLQIIYAGEYPVVALAQNKAEVAAQRLKEGVGTGYVEARYANLKVHTLDAMFAIAQAQLGYYSQTMTTLVFTTRTGGITQGQTLKVNLPDFTLNNRAMLVESVEITDSIDAANIWYVVTCVGSPYSVAQWQTFWQHLLNQDNAADINADNQSESASIAEVAQSQAIWQWSGHTTATKQSCLICGPATLCGPAQLVC